MFFIYSYKGFTISHKIGKKEFFISYPDESPEISPSIYTFSLEKAYNFIDEITA